MMNKLDQKLEEIKTLVYEIKILAYEGVVILDNQKHKIEAYCKGDE